MSETVRAVLVALMVAAAVTIAARPAVVAFVNRKRRPGGRRRYLLTAGLVALVALMFAAGVAVGG